jgi:hypothetical protein
MGRIGEAAAGPLAQRRGLVGVVALLVETLPNDELWSAGKPVGEVAGRVDDT